MSIKIAINGFGRIGRNTFKAGLQYPELEFVAINDLTDTQTLAHLLRYDTVFGSSGLEVIAKENALIVNGKEIKVVAEKEPAKLPWKDLNIDVVLECSGRFTSLDAASAHLTAGAKKVIISAPAKGVPTYVLGVNSDQYRGETIINNASCTTNCISPVTSVLEESFGIAKALMTTVHAITAEQNLTDSPPPGLKKGDLRRARGAYQNMVPTTTGAAIATTEAIPELKGLFDGLSVRVPIADVSLSDLVFLLKKKTSVQEINETFIKASQLEKWKGILGVTDQPLVSSDFIGSSYSAIVDLSLTKVIDGDLVKIIAWYDNEWGYSCRLVEMCKKIGSQA